MVGKTRKRNSWFCSMDDHSEWMCRQKLHVTKQGKPNDPNGNMCSQCSCGSVCPQRLLARPMRIAKKLVMMILSGEVPTKPQLSAPKGVLPSAWMVHVFLRPVVGPWLQGTEVSPKFPRFSKDVRPNAHLL